MNECKPDFETTDTYITARKGEGEGKGREEETSKRTIVAITVTYQPTDILYNKIQQERGDSIGYCVGLPI